MPTRASATCRGWFASRPRPVVINRRSVEARMGANGETHEFQLAIISHFITSRNGMMCQILIAWDHPVKGPPSRTPARRH